MTNVKIKIAGPLLQLLWKRGGWIGWCSPWRTIYVRSDHCADQRLIAHETRHAAQMEHDGVLWWHLRYAWWLLKYGYRMNPYEIDARNAESR